MRFHNLKYIEKVAEVPADALSGHSSSGGSATSTTKYTVADLYSFVKNYDKDFTAGKPVNKEFINSDGTPKIFYHGTPNGTFTEFRDWQYFTPNEDYAGNYLNQGASSNGYKKNAS